MQMSVVVPTFRRRDLVRRTVQTLLQQDFPAAEYELVVVVDGSTDETASTLRQMQSRCRLRIIEQENKGLAAARNAGWRAAEGEVVLFIDDDMRCDPGLLREHSAAHRSEDPVVGFGAIFLSPDSPNSLAAECFKRELGAYHLEQVKNPAKPFPESACVFGNTSVLRRVLQDVNGFDERFRAREDAELGVRLSAVGIKPRYVAGAIAYQFYDKTSRDLIRDAEAFAGADVLFVRTHPSKSSHTFLNMVANEDSTKNFARRTAALYPPASEIILAPVCFLCEELREVGLFRSLGARALQVRRGIHWYRKVLELDKGLLSELRHRS
jgi:glycosyltransferase involved in cell wall biosynthesis